MPLPTRLPSDREKMGATDNRDDHELLDAAVEAVKQARDKIADLMLICETGALDEHLCNMRSELADAITINGQNLVHREIEEELDRTDPERIANARNDWMHNHAMRTAI